MLRIATHDSVTGENPANILSVLVSPFSKTQTKTIAQQFASGCRVFDIRVKKYKGNWHGAHGLFTTKRTIYDILKQLNQLAKTDKDNPVIINVVYEGNLLKNIKTYEQFTTSANNWMQEFSNIQFGDFITKYPKWQKVLDGNQVSFYPHNINYQQFKPLDFSSWHSLIPIPILWKQFYFKHPVFNEESFTYVDFL